VSTRLQSLKFILDINFRIREKQFLPPGGTFLSDSGVGRRKYKLGQTKVYSGGVYSFVWPNLFFLLLT
jgi:hypothetical protein